MAHVPPRQGTQVFGIGPGRFVLVQHPTRDESDEYYLCAHINNGCDWVALTTQEEDPTRSSGRSSSCALTHHGPRAAIALSTERTRAAWLLGWCRGK